MSFSLWLQRLRRKTKAPNSPKGKRSIAAKPRVEWLEPRLAPATITVTSTNDDLAVDGTVSLREAISSINAGANVNADVVAVGTYGTNDTIDFLIRGAGVQTIAVASALPTITKPVVIDGYSQPGASPNTLAVGDNAVILIELNGAGAITGTDGLDIAAANSTVRGLAINHFSSGDGIRVFGAGAMNNVVAGNFIGTDATGTVALANSDGVALDTGATTNTIGGLTSGARNVISGNAQDGVSILNGFSAGSNFVEGNYIGTDVTGAAALGNGGDGVFITGSFNTVGVGNVISGNTFDGVDISATETTVEGNLIGTNAAGTAVLGNRMDGVLILGSVNTIGGTLGGLGNVISGNMGVAGSGVDISGSGATNNLVEGNFIGTDLTGTLNLGNIGDGVTITGAAHNIIGGFNVMAFPGVTGAGGISSPTGNIIAFNTGAGVNVNDGTFPPGSAIDNVIVGNAIFANSRLGIDLGGSGTPVLNDSQGHVGPNNFQNFPVLSSASNSASGTTILGTLHSSPSTIFTLEFFSNQAPDPSGFGQGQTFLGRMMVNTDGIGNASFTATFATQVPAGQFISSTATDPNNNTSEFSQDVLVQRGGAILVTGIAFCAKEGVPVNNAAVATFTDSGVPQPAGNYTATINWGDGSPLTAGMVTASGSTFTVLGSHTYAAEEFYTVTVTVSDPYGRSGTESLSVLVGGFVTSLYQDVLNRLPDRPGLDAWVQQLHAGTLNRQQVALGFLTSPEARGLQIDLYYATFLHRTADPAGRQGWVQQLMAGVSESQVLVGILTSPEFTASHPDATSFVNALFVGILNRTGGASEVSLWQQRLDSGALTRADAILGFLSSTEAYGDAIDENYLTFLDRQPDPAGQQFWFSLILSGRLTPTTFSAAILGSDEYLALALTCPPPPT